MPQMKPLNWLIIFLTIIVSMSMMISFIYFAMPPLISNKISQSPRPNLSWSWKW